jgi:hypothetical protein
MATRIEWEAAQWAGRPPGFDELRAPDCKRRGLLTRERDSGFARLLIFNPFLDDHDHPVGDSVIGNADRTSDEGRLDEGIELELISLRDMAWTTQILQQFSKVQRKRSNLLLLHFQRDELDALASLEVKDALSWLTDRADGDE